MARMEDVSPLSRSELFSSLGADALARVAANTTTVRLERNDILFSEGDEADNLFVVVRGRIAIAKKSPDGRESLVALMEPGDTLGEMPLFDDQPRSALARALERSELARVPFAVVRSELQAQPAALWDVVALFANRLRATDDSLADAMLLDVTGRTAKRLLELAGPADEFVLPITQEELAHLIGASREGVNRAISAFVRLGWICLGDGRYRIMDRERLAERSR